MIVLHPLSAGYHTTFDSGKCLPTCPVLDWKMDERTCYNNTDEETFSNIKRLCVSNALPGTM